MLFMDALEMDLADDTRPNAIESIPDLIPSNLYWKLVKAYTAFNSHTHGCSRGKYSHISTGHWGCDAFGGNKQVEAIIQWYAASLAHAWTE